MSSDSATNPTNRISSNKPDSGGMHQEIKTLNEKAQFVPQKNEF
jgi:hypothetical protein